VGLERTGLYASSLQISCLCLCLVAIFLPGSPFVLLHPESTAANASSSSSSTTFSSSSAALQLNVTAGTAENHIAWTTVAAEVESTPTTMTTAVGADSVVVDVTQRRCKDNPYGSFLSIGVMMAGIILARFGLWNLDLTITQILQEQVGESERGIVNGVQHSLQDLLDMIKFILVIFIPHPKHFAYLVILSFIFVTAGGCFYASYTTRVRGHFFHFELLRVRSKRDRRQEQKRREGDDDAAARTSGAATARGEPEKRVVAINGTAKDAQLAEFRAHSSA